MARYDSSLRLSEGLDLYYKASGIDPKLTYEERWAKIRFGPLHFYVPNTETRKRELRIHDIHHVLTGFETSWRGETQISAWEIGSGGCGSKLFIWAIILSVGLIGLFLNPRAMLRAYRMGRSCRNLFGQDYSRYLSMTVGELRTQLNIVV